MKWQILLLSILWFRIYLTLAEHLLYNFNQVTPNTMDTLLFYFFTQDLNSNSIYSYCLPYNSHDVSLAFFYLLNAWSRLPNVLQKYQLPEKISMK